MLSRRGNAYYLLFNSNSLTKPNIPYAGTFCWRCLCLPVSQYRGSACRSKCILLLVTNIVWIIYHNDNYDHETNTESNLHSSFHTHDGKHCFCIPTSHGEWTAKSPHLPWGPDGVDTWWNLHAMLSFILSKGCVFVKYKYLSCFRGGSGRGHCELPSAVYFPCETKVREWA